MFGVDLFPFARLRRQFVQFGELPGETLALQLQLAVARLRMLDRLNLLAPGAPCSCDGGRRFGEAFRPQLELEYIERLLKDN